MIKGLVEKIFHLFSLISPLFHRDNFPHDAVKLELILKKKKIWQQNKKVKRKKKFLQKACDVGFIFFFIYFLMFFICCWCYFCMCVFDHLYLTDVVALLMQYETQWYISVYVYEREKEYNELDPQTSWPTLTVLYM